MLTPAEWKQIGKARCEELHRRLLALPTQYQAVVIRRAQNNGIPTLRHDVLLGPAECSAYDGLIFLCERAIRDQQQKRGKS